MTRLRISIKTLSPLYAGALKPYGSFLETHAQISGALLRGAVAQKTLPDCAAPEFINNHEACEVKDICPFYYLITGVEFPTCSVAEGGRPTESPLRTMVTCKAAPGFTAQSTTQDPRHGVYDALLDHLAFTEWRRFGRIPTKLPRQRCAACQAPLEPFTRRYVKEASERYHAAAALRTRRMTHVGINRSRETAERGLLFSVQAIAESTHFVGRMTVPTSWDGNRVTEFQNTLSSITRLGGEQTYGLGRVEITVREEDDIGEDVPARISMFNETFKEVWRQYTFEFPPREPEGDYLSIDLLTPALLTSPDGTPTVQLTVDMLTMRAEELGYSDLPPVEPVIYRDASDRMHPLMFTAPMVVGGWSAAWGLPKRTALAAVGGSVYIFRTEHIGPWYEALAMIEAHGLGDRREEGFGAVRVCDPFHREVEAQ